ncbi:hypothetical protein Psi02_39360 [Planotetraspora silvatica]|uniref:Uncharacterized protein n=1 Tax=Planotetraspora silvatica TaxID=234614 RepID=A0A8J3XMJ8_9ACTN|nr:hypothetical protein [Planotetraspora silvatica]GII47512.1 hypothetical protein Psi02_39360 [Planotetraspora silvatica]
MAGFGCRRLVLLGLSRLRLDGFGAVCAGSSRCGLSCAGLVDLGLVHHLGHLKLVYLGLGHLELAHLRPGPLVRHAGFGCRI